MKEKKFCYIKMSQTYQFAIYFTEHGASGKCMMFPIVIAGAWPVNYVRIDERKSE